MAIRNHTLISRICVGQLVHRLALFADDIILFLRNLKVSIPALVELMKRFSSFSGSKINTLKSSILLLNSFENLKNFKIVNSFTYLGIHITSKLEEIVQTNYTSMVKSIFESVDKWTSLSISVIGRINILKMNILPKLLYLFQNIPMLPPSNFFSSLQKLFNPVIWKNRRPRLRLSLLYLTFDRGGLKFPDLLWYYWATQIRSMRFYYSSDSSPAWKGIEVI